MERERLYAFDIDVNLFYFPSTIVMEYYDEGAWKETEVNSKDYVDKKERDDYRLTQQSNPFYYFDDDKTFLHSSFEVIESYPDKVGLSFDKFKESLKEGDTLSLITARGHKPNVIRAFLINLILYTSDIEDWNGVDDDVLNIVNGIYIYPVSSDEFNDQFDTDNENYSVPYKKRLAFKDFLLEHYLLYNEVSIGYSDDDPKNVEQIEDLIHNELKDKCPNCHFVTYNTSGEGVDKKPLTLKKSKDLSNFVKTKNE